MKRLSIPLSAQLLLWWYLNMLLGCAVLLVVVPRHLQHSWMPFLTQGVHERLQQIGESIASELEPAINRGWRVDLQRFSDHYAMSFSIYDGAGRRVAGQDDVPPQTVLREVEITAALMATDLTGNAAQGNAAGAQGLVRGELPPWPRPDREVLKRWQFVVHTETRPHYWVGIRTPLIAADGGLVPATILATTSDFWALVRFLDMSEWVDALLLLVAVSTLLWAPLLWVLTRQLGRIRRQVERLGTGHFDTRIGLRRPDELGQIAGAVDTLASRLDSFVQSQQHFIANIAHEVASPLGRLQLGLEVLHREIEARAQACFDDVHEEVQLLSELVAELLAYSRIGLGEQPRLTALSLRAVVSSVLQREGGGDRVAVDIPMDLQVYGDSALLVRALGNLVRNSLRYAGTPMELTAHRDSQTTTLRVLDRGPGVPELSLLKLGDAFYRPEAARRRETGGLGLGLATVKNCIAACGGSVSFRNREGGGFEVQLTLRSVM